MTAYERPTDSLPISTYGDQEYRLGGCRRRRSQFLHRLRIGAGRSANVGRRRFWSSVQRVRWKPGTDSQSRGYPGRQRQGLFRCANGDHAAESQGIQGVQLDLYPSGLPGGRCHHHDQLPLSRQQILDHRRLGGEPPGAQAAAGKDDQGRGRQSGCHLRLGARMRTEPFDKLRHVKLRRR